MLCPHFRYLRGAQFTIRTDHSSLRWLQKFCNGDEMLARWYMLLGLLLLSTVRGLSMQMRMVCIDSVDNVRGLTVWYPLPFRGVLRWTPRRFCWISLSPHRRWVSPWVRTCCRSCLGNLGGGHVIGRTYSGFVTSWIGSGP